MGCTEPMVSVVEKVNSLAEVSSTPLSVHFELTYRCNLRCSHCYLSRDDTREELSTKEVERTLDELAEAGCLFLTFTGGEILLRQDIFEILRTAKSKGFALALFTNGTLIDPETADLIQSLSPLRVELSIYGADSDTHDGVTGVRGSFNRSVSAARLVRERGIKVVLKCPLMKENVTKYGGVVELSKSLGANCKFDPIITPKNDGSREPLSHRLGGEELLEPIRELGLYPRAPRPINENGRELLCDAGVTTCSISPYGDVYPCVQLPMLLGNLREESFREIWRNSTVLSELKALKNSDLASCQVCDLSPYCSRCLGLALSEDGDLLGPSKACCQLAEVRGQLIRAWTATHGSDN